MELYIHIPFCMKKCDYCDFLSAPYGLDVRRAYTDALCREIAFFGKKLAGETVETIFVGGGTPSWLETELLDAIMRTVHRSFAVDGDAEISMECNPGTASPAAFASYRGWGLNRLSIGLQSANDDELATLGRIHNYDRFLRTYDHARRAGIFNINVDIMTGLPGQMPEKLYHTLQQVIGLRPEHISAYALMIEEGTPFYERYKFDAVKQHAGMETELLPDDETAYRLTKLTEQVLAEHGFIRYEISNFAKEGFACRHNVGYWTRVPYLGVGLGAASLLGHTRYANERGMESYLRHCEDLPEDGAGASPLWETVDELSRKDEIAEYLYLGLRMTDGISRRSFEEAFGQSIDAYYKEVMERLRDEGMLLLDGGRVRLTEQGMDLSNRVLAEFLLE